MVEYIPDYQKRADDIKNHKPKDEQELRLRLFKLIPPDRLPAGLRRLDAKCNQAYAELEKAAASWVKDYAELRRAEASWVKDSAELEKAYAENMPLLEKLHEELCLECPWDGKTIFPKDAQAKE